MRWLARDTGADPAATDSARVLRLPGFYNHKYDTPYMVSFESMAARIHRPEDFVQSCWRQEGKSLNGGSERRIEYQDTLSQSERDWSYAKRALARGDPEEVVSAAIAFHRRYDKPDPQYYADLTVKNAQRELTEERSQSQPPPDSSWER